MSDDLHLDQHISHKFNEELEAVRSRVLTMGGLVETQCKRALKALVKGNAELGAKVAGKDHEVNEMELEINAQCTDIIARRQPAASDLRMVISIIRMSADLERIGDEAEKIGRLAEVLAEGKGTKAYQADTRHLGKRTLEMLRGALDAFARLDVEGAIQVAEMDLEVDQDFEALTRLLISHMTEHPNAVSDLLRVNWCARALERIGDHAVNICEEVVFLVKGSDVRHLSAAEIRERFPSEG